MGRGANKGFSYRRKRRKEGFRLASFASVKSLEVDACGVGVPWPERLRKGLTRRRGGAEKGRRWTAFLGGGSWVDCGCGSVAVDFLRA